MTKRPHPETFVRSLASHGKLKTMDHNLASIILSSSTCVLCNQEIESHDHLFFKCDYSKKVWENINFRVGIKWSSLPWEQVIQWVTFNYHRKSKMNKMITWTILGALIYFIWQERNRRVFSSQFEGGMYLVKKIFQVIKAHLSCMPNSSLPGIVKGKWRI